MNSNVYDKTMGNLRNRTDVKLVSNKKNPFKMEIKTKLTFSKAVYVGTLHEK